MRFVRDLHYLSAYKLLLFFDDGKKKVVDLKPHLEGEIFQPLKKIEYFRTVSLNKDIDTIAWDNGADLSPDFLYEIGREEPDLLVRKEG